MASFKDAIKKLLYNEGGYVNDPLDKGGETYKGISRKYHGDDPMWAKIDKYKELYGSDVKKLTSALNKDDEISKSVETIYKRDYWDKFDLDNVSKQKVAEQVFDDSVNRGVAAASKILSALFGLKKTSKPTSEIKEKLSNL